MYSNLAKLKENFGTLKDLILQNVEDNVLENVLKDASDIIDSYVSIVYELPIDDSPILDNIALNIAKAKCYRQFARNDLPEDVLNQEKSSYRLLEKIQQKRISLKRESKITETKTEVFVSKRYFSGWCD